MEEPTAFLHFEHSELEGVSQYYRAGLASAVNELDVGTEVATTPPVFCEAGEALDRIPLQGFPSNPTSASHQSLNVGLAGVANLFYLAFLWRLTEGLARFVTFPHHGVSAPWPTGEVVKWQYRLWARSEDYFWKVGETQPSRDFLGFSPHALEGDHDRIGRGTLFPVTSFRELLELQTYPLADASCETVAYAVGRDHETTLLERLRDESPPSLKEVLGQQGLLVDYLCGIDLGYWTAMQILTRNTLEGILQDLNADLARATRAYSDSIELIESVNYEDFVLRILRV